MNRNHHLLNIAAAIGLAIGVAIPAGMALAQTPPPPPLLRVTPAGPVGIGVADPHYALDVDGDINLTGCVRVNGVPIQGSTCSIGNLRSALPPASSPLPITPSPAPKSTLLNPRDLNNTTK